jgi:hypothetical protein
VRTYAIGHNEASGLVGSVRGGGFSRLSDGLQCCHNNACFTEWA